MSHAFIIEVNSRAAGIIVRNGRGFRFHAASADFSGLEGRDFRSPGDAHKAALRHAEIGTGGRPPRLKVA